MQPKHLGVFFGLLQARPGGLPRGLGLDDGKGEAALVGEQVIDAFRRFADEAFPDGNDATVSDRALLGDGMGIILPPCRLEGRHDVLAAGVGFVHGLESRVTGGCDDPLLLP